MVKAAIYAMRSQTRRLTQWKPESPAAAWYVFDLFGKKWLSEPLFSKKIGMGPSFPKNLHVVQIFWER